MVNKILAIVLASLLMACSTSNNESVHEEQKLNSCKTVYHGFKKTITEVTPLNGDTILYRSTDYFNDKYQMISTKEENLMFGFETKKEYLYEDGRLKSVKEWNNYMQDVSEVIKMVEQYNDQNLPRLITSLDGSFQVFEYEGCNIISRDTHWDDTLRYSENYIIENNEYVGFTRIYHGRMVAANEGRAEQKGQNIILERNDRGNWVKQYLVLDADTSIMNRTIEYWP